MHNDIDFSGYEKYSMDQLLTEMLKLRKLMKFERKNYNQHLKSIKKFDRIKTNGLGLVTEQEIIDHNFLHDSAQRSRTSYGNHRIHYHYLQSLYYKVLAKNEDVLATDKIYPNTKLPNYAKEKHYFVAPPYLI